MDIYDEDNNEDQIKVTEKWLSNAKAIKLSLIGVPVQISGV